MKNWSVYFPSSGNSGNPKPITKIVVHLNDESDAEEMVKLISASKDLLDNAEKSLRVFEELYAEYKRGDIYDRILKLRSILSRVKIKH